MKAVIILKCDGRQDNGFYYCVGVENIILDLENIEHTEKYLYLIQYLDKVAKIFDGPCLKAHVISNALFKLQEMGYISEIMYKYFAYFFEMHKRCGLVLMAMPKEVLNGTPKS